MKKLIISVLLLVGLLISYPSFASTASACLLAAKKVNTKEYVSFLTCDGKKIEKLNRIGQNSSYEEVSGQVKYVIETYKLKMINCQLGIGEYTEYICLFSK